MLRLLEYAVFGELSIRQVEIARENLLADDTGSAGAVCFAFQPLCFAGHCNRITERALLGRTSSLHTNCNWSDMIAREFTDLT